MSQGTRGKWAEGKVRAHLNVLAQRGNFNFMRLPDARAGSFASITADYLVGNKGVGWMLEVKEVNHEFRLPRPNYPTEQRSRVRMWEMAGFKSLVIVGFLPLKGAVYRADRPMWRTSSLKYFTGDNTSSWDMRDQPLLTLAEALDELTRD